MGNPIPPISEWKVPQGWSFMDSGGGCLGWFFESVKPDSPDETFNLFVGDQDLLPGVDCCNEDGEHLWSAGFMTFRETIEFMRFFTLLKHPTPL